MALRDIGFQASDMGKFLSSLRVSEAQRKQEFREQIFERFRQIMLEKFLQKRQRDRLAGERRSQLIASALGAGGQIASGALTSSAISGLV